MNKRSLDKQYVQLQRRYAELQKQCAELQRHLRVIRVIKKIGSSVEAERTNGQTPILARGLEAKALGRVTTYAARIWLVEMSLPSETFETVEGYFEATIRTPPNFRC